MKTEQIVLVTAGLLGIAAFFFPYVHFVEVKLFKTELIDIHVSGYNYVEAALDATDVAKSGKGKRIVNHVVDMWNESASIQDYASFVGFIFIMLGPVYFLLYALGYLFRGLTGKSYKRGIFFALLFLGLSWLAFYMYGQQINMNFNFFDKAGIGFWMGFSAVILGAFSVFFEKSTKKS